MAVDKVKQGKKNRAAGGAHELKTRKDLEAQGWTVDKWSNNVELETATLASADGKETVRVEHIFGKIVPAKRKYAGPGRPMAIGTGFPDFIAFKRRGCSLCHARTGSSNGENFDVVGVECKTNGNLDKTEKDKCRWYLKEKKFNRIYIAEKTKVKNRVVIVYHDFEERYGKV